LTTSTFVAPVYAFTARMNARMRFTMTSFEWYCSEAWNGSAGPHVVA
jgi:hypothetical protein